MDDEPVANDELPVTELRESGIFLSEAVDLGRVERLVAPRPRERASKPPVPRRSATNWRPDAEPN